jgi:hypothetical protein
MAHNVLPVGEDFKYYLSFEAILLEFSVSWSNGDFHMNFHLHGNQRYQVSSHAMIAQRKNTLQIQRSMHPSTLAL